MVIPYAKLNGVTPLQAHYSSAASHQTVILRHPSLVITISASMKAVSEIQTFGDLSPWAEPAWYSTLESPYYNDSHRRLRSWVRDYLEQNVIPFQEEWEESGEVPKEVRSRATLILTQQ